MEFTAIRTSTASAAGGEQGQDRIGGGDCPSPDQPAAAVEKEHMFDKVVTPSDVGKLNRLVIPKQHAEKYFPLDASSTDKGLLLSFEDRAGKPWRFRYSYWNSSQSYVMTKGWSRFVKEKRLNAGDTVSFGRGVGEAARDRLFIDWCRRPDVVAAPLAHHRGHFALSSVPFAPWTTHYPVGGGGRMFMPGPSPSSMYDYDAHHYHQRRQVGYDGYGAAAGRQVLFYRPQQQYHHHHQSVVLESVPVRMAVAPGHPEPSVATSGSKRVRLFGVNLECATSSEEDFGGPGRMAPPSLQLLSPASSSSSSSGKARCSLNLDL